MKRILAFLVCATLYSTAHGQVIISLLLGDQLNSGKVEFGLEGGLNYSQIRGLSGGEAAPQFNLGFYFDIKLKDPHWMIHTGVIVKSTLGSKGLPVYSLNNAHLDSAFASGSVQRNLNYFNVPISMKYVFDNHFYVEGGVMPALRAGANDLFTASVKSENDLEYKLSITDQIRLLDFGLIGGVGYRLMGGNGINLTLRYYYGLVNVLVDDSKPSQFNTSLYFSVGIPIGAGKARERAEQQK